jgi:putative hydrolase of the HAD superfamily
MVGNSWKSDIAPVLALGGRAVHVPYPLLWALEHVEIDASHPRVASVPDASGIPAALEALESTA